MSDTSPQLETVRCHVCEAANPPGANYCQNCGNDLQLADDGHAHELQADATIVIRAEDLRKVAEKSQHSNVDAALAEMTAVAGNFVAFKSDIGKKHRVNQDAGYAGAWLRQDGVPTCLLVVADGVSAGRHSEAASQLAVEVISRTLAPLLESSQLEVDAILSELVRAIKDANHQIAARPSHAISSADATTIVVAFTVGEQGAGAWVGDSRVYLTSQGEVTRLTRDHSWADGVVSRGIMSTEQAARDSRAHMIMRWLGPPDQEDPGVDTFDFVLEPGDVVFCCTDGLYMYFTPPTSGEDEMANVLIAHGDNLGSALDELVTLALDRGGYDNISIAALKKTSTAMDGGGLRSVTS